MSVRAADHYDSLTVPQSVTALTRKGLRLAMLKLNREMNRRILFQDIQQIEENGKKLWCAWYYEKVELSEAEDLSGTS